MQMETFAHFLLRACTVDGKLKPQRLTHLKEKKFSGQFTFVPFFFFFFLLFTAVLSQWDFSRGKFGLPSPGKVSFDRVALSNLQCMLGVLVLP